MERFGGVNGWSGLYAGQVRVFNAVWGGLQHWQVAVIEHLREGRRVMTGSSWGCSSGVDGIASIWILVKRILELCDRHQGHHLIMQIITIHT